MNTPLPALVVACASGTWMGVQGDSGLEVGRRILGSDEAGEQKDRPGGRESTGCGTDADIQADDGGGTGEDGKESVVSVPSAKARRDAFI